MDVWILGISIITYMLLFNRCLTFQLKIINNIVIAGMILIHIVLVRRWIGNLFVIPMMIIMVLYIILLKKEDSIWNVFLIIFSFLLLVILDNSIHLICSLMELDQSITWLVYLIIVYPVFFTTLEFVVKKIRAVKNKILFKLSFKIIAVIGIDLILCMFIFIGNIRLSEQAGNSPEVLLLSVILYMPYFILTFFMIVIIVKEYEKNAKIMAKQNSYDNLQDYMSKMEELYLDMRTFKHDYANVMTSMAVYLEHQDLAGLKEYYYSQILPISNLLHQENDVLARLHNLKIVELKGLLSVKINYALERKIKVKFEITDPINHINMKSIDLVRVIGILFDNAMEACQEHIDPLIDLSIIKTEQGIVFIIKNTYIRQELDYSKLGNLGVTSKGQHRGMGLYNVRSILREYDNMIIDTEYTEEYFTQFLEIYENN